ncbi:hypothetical protein T12_5518 [Trichinella patagoniensis]|uniref:Uncharacterized protein n=1 Tax=Trichinella patagoniensis TaxID=990121 RepID=A0A0V0ZAH3_9BILA|nr:hypothetical protein T12_5518 [Trichinella patagoniensis]
MELYQSRADTQIAGNIRVQAGQNYPDARHGFLFKSAVEPILCLETLQLHAGDVHMTVQERLHNVAEAHLRAFDISGWKVEIIFDVVRTTTPGWLACIPLAISLRKPRTSKPLICAQSPANRKALNKKSSTRNFGIFFCSFQKLPNKHQTLCCPAFTSNGLLNSTSRLYSKTKISTADPQTQFYAPMHASIVHTAAAYAVSILDFLFQ